MAIGLSATFARQWANLSNNRGIPDAGSFLLEVSELLVRARFTTEAAAEKLFEVQDAEATTPDHEH